MFKQFWVRRLSSVLLLLPVLWARPWQQNAWRSSAGVVRKSGGEENEPKAAQTPTDLWVRDGGWWHWPEGEETGIIIIIFTYGRGQTDVCLKSDKKKKTRRKSISKAPGENNNFVFEPKLGKITWRKLYSFIHIPPTMVLRLSHARYRIRACVPFGVISSYRRRPRVATAIPLAILCTEYLDSKRIAYHFFFFELFWDLWSSIKIIFLKSYTCPATTTNR